jgi:hypothetical protein
LTDDPNPLSVSDILGPLLELGGIKSSSSITFKLYLQSPFGVRSLTIKSYAMFLRTLGTAATYQLVVEEPVIEGLDVQPFKITYLTIEAEYNGTNGWSKPRVHTEEEEIWPETTDFKSRATRVAEKIMRALEILVIMKEIGGSLGLFPSGGPPPS